MNGYLPVMFLSPPWALPVIAPLGLINSYFAGWSVWSVALLLTIAAASWMAMEVYFANLRIADISDSAFYRCLFAFTFFPVLLSLRFSQTAAFVLLGLAGLVYFENTRRPALAGVLVSLTLVKPHLTYLIWPALLFSLRKRETRILLTATAITLIVLTSISLLLDPGVVQHYLQLTTGPYMQAFPSGITWGVRRMLGGIGTFWIEFLPPVAGLIWVVSYWRKHHDNWSWRTRLPVVVTVSVLTSAYGWLFDQSVLVLPIMYIAAEWSRNVNRIPRAAVMVYTALNCVLMLSWPLPTVSLLPAPLILLVLIGRLKYLRSSETVIPAAVEFSS